MERIADLHSYSPFVVVGAWQSVDRGEVAPSAALPEEPAAKLVAPRLGSRFAKNRPTSCPLCLPKSDCRRLWPRFVAMGARSGHPTNSNLSRQSSHRLFRMSYFAQT